ncbi:hypothetical protein [Deinococcus pimensis]|uniref:hypothetical protein n=1 Tax=Deinococcus pimensis TaxID=309888 RepID=UPI0004854B0D|nr:hypothetical protein [Deinococcus pimensis]
MTRALTLGLALALGTVLAQSGGDTAPVTLAVTAPAGTLVTYDVTQTLVGTVEEVRVEPRPNVRLTAEALEDYKRRFAGAGGNPKPVNLSYVEYLRVLPPTADGSVALQVTSDQTIEGLTQKLRYRQVISPDGTTRVEALPGTSPELRRVVESLDTSGVFGTTPAVYGRPLTVDAPVTQEGRLDFARVLGSSLPGVSLSGDVTYRNVLTYRGARPDGTRLVETASTFGPATVTVEAGGLRQTVEVGAGTASSSTTLRPDGLASRLESRSTARIGTRLDLPELPVVVTVVVRQEQTLRQTAR